MILDVLEFFGIVGLYLLPFVVAGFIFGAVAGWLIVPWL